MAKGNHASSSVAKTKKEFEKWSKKRYGVGNLQDEY